jgi:hypothetical protein
MLEVTTTRPCKRLYGIEQEWSLTTDQGYIFSMSHKPGNPKVRKADLAPKGDGPGGIRSVFGAALGLEIRGFEPRNVRPDARRRQGLSSTRWSQTHIGRPRRFAAVSLREKSTEFGLHGVRDLSGPLRPARVQLQPASSAGTPVDFCGGRLALYGRSSSSSGTTPPCHHG